MLLLNNKRPYKSRYQDSAWPCGGSLKSLLRLYDTAMLIVTQVALRHDENRKLLENLCGPNAAAKADEHRQLTQGADCQLLSLHADTLAIVFECLVASEPAALVALARTCSDFHSVTSAAPTRWLTKCKVRALDDLVHHLISTDPEDELVGHSPRLGIGPLKVSRLARERCSELAGLMPL